jgi:hypothetical protein
LLENYISTHGKRPSPQNGRAFLSGNIEKELWGMEKTFQYHQQIFAGLELEIYNDLLKKDKIFLQCMETAVWILDVSSLLYITFIYETNVDVVLNGSRIQTLKQKLLI